MYYKLLFHEFLTKNNLYLHKFNQITLWHVSFYWTDKGPLQVFSMTFYQIGQFPSSCHPHGCGFCLYTTAKKRKLDFFSITEPCRFLFEAAIFNSERLLYCT